MYSRLIPLTFFLMLTTCSDEKESKVTTPTDRKNTSGSETSRTARKARDSSNSNHWIFSVPFKRIEKGSFGMGSPIIERGRDDDEGPVHVEISKPFEIMTKELTQNQWFQVMGNNPSRFKEEKHCDDHSNGMCPNNPVERVSWNNVQEYIKKLNESLGQTGCNGTPQSKKGCYRLPTEAEWEYATRGGTKTAYSFGTDPSQIIDYAWYSDPWYRYGTGSKTYKVGLKEPNPKGLYDVHGNVWEWVQDKYTSDLPGGKDPLHTSSGSSRVFRGGSWGYFPLTLRSANRNYDDPADSRHDVGFRLVRTL